MDAIRFFFFCREDIQLKWFLMHSCHATRYVCAAMPLGTVSVVAADVATALAAAEPPPPLSGAGERQPAWRPSAPLGKSKNVVLLEIMEYVRAVQ